MTRIQSRFTSNLQFNIIWFDINYFPVTISVRFTVCRPGLHFQFENGVFTSKTLQ